MNRKMKIVVITLLLLVTGFVDFYGIRSTCNPRVHEHEGHLAYIESITGIFSKAEIKRGCPVVGVATYFPTTNSEGTVWATAGYAPSVYQAIDPSYEPVRTVWIIDVYRDQCTIVFGDIDSGSMCKIENFPLANLDYDEGDVARASDNIHTSLYNTRYTLHRSEAVASKLHSPVFLILFNIAVIVGVVLICRSKKNYTDSIK